jgi:RND family efflux transporter MFP subunit
LNDSNSGNADLSTLRINREDNREPVRAGRYFRLLLWVAIPVAALIILWLVLSRISPAIEVRVSTATELTRSQARAVLSATGYVVAQRKAAVASKATGRLEYMGIEEGDAVVKDQVIARIENEDMQAALELAKANLAQAQAESIEAHLDYARKKEFLASGAITSAEFESSDARYNSSLARVKAARASVKSADVALDNTYIRAPFDGTVLTKYADVGEIVAPFGSSSGSRAAVAVLADMKSLEVEADVSESNIQKIQLGQKCEIILDAYPRDRYDGYVKKIVPTADRAKATVLTKVAFEKMDSKVLPEMSARVNFLSGESIEEPESEASRQSRIPALVVPGSAVVTREGRKLVFIVANKRAVATEVETGRELGNLIEIIDGIRPGQKVIVSPPSNLNDGDRVKIIE